jgi:type IV secretory pathway TrbD component
MIKGGKRSVVFLAATATVLGWEVYASWDDDPETSPWTDLIVTYLPGEVTAVAIGGLVAWLPVHFGLRYWRKRRSRKGGGG